MPTHDQRRHGLHIAGGRSPFSRGDRHHGDPQIPGPLVTPPPRRVPVFDPRLGRAVMPPRINDPWRVRLKVALTCLTAAMIGAAAFLSFPHDSAPTPDTASAAFSDPAALSDPYTLSDPVGPSDPALLEPTTAPTSSNPVAVSSVSSTPPVPKVSHPAARAAPTGRPSGAGTPPPTVRTPPAPALRAGTVIGLAERERPAFRVRHRNFLGRVDRIGPGSSDLDHADSTFAVRPAAGGCVAFESVNFPGRFLRHRNFVIRLDQADGSALFRLDSTFCPVSAGPGAFVLRSANYPSRYVSERQSSLLLSEVPAGSATAFVVEAPF